MKHALVALALALAACPGKKKESPEPTPPSQPSGSGSAGTGAAGGDNGAIVQPRIGGDPGARPHELACAIVAVHENQQPTKVVPFYGAGGKWTYLDLKTPGGNTFTVGFVQTRTLQSDIPITLYDVRVQSTDGKPAPGVVDELAKALGTPVPPNPGADKTPPLVPLALVASQLGGDVARNPDGSFGGTGNWKATKWTSERAGHAAELFFNYSLADKQAELSEKDDAYNADIVADIALALRDGGAAQN